MKRLLFVISFVIFISSNARAEVIAYWGFENSNEINDFASIPDCQTGQTCETSTVTVTTAESFAGNSSLFFHSLPSSFHNMLRTERYITNFAFNQRYLIGYSFKVPSWFTQNNLYLIVFQFHGVRDTPQNPGSCDAWRNPVNTIYFQDANNLKLTLRAQSDDCCLLPTDTCHTYNVDNTYNNIGFNRGSWNTVVWEVEFDPVGNGGFTKLWVNRDPYTQAPNVSYSGGPAGFNDQIGHTLSFGTYQSRQNPQAYDVYIDELSIATGSNYSEVFPGGGGGTPTDTTAPSINVTPLPTQPVGTVSVVVSAKATDVSNPCAMRWGTSNVDYDSMTNTWDTTDGINFTDTITVSDGQNIFYARAVDNKGNKSSASTIFTVTVDTSGGGSDNILKTSATCTVAETLDSEHQLPALWDGLYGPANWQYTAGAGNIDQMTITCLLDQDFVLDKTRTFGNNVGTWTSTLWAMKYKLDSNSSWIDLFTNQVCSSDMWYEQDVSAATRARYIQYILIGNTADHATQFDELELTGSVYTGGEEPPSTINNANWIKGSSKSSPINKGSNNAVSFGK